MSAYGFCECGCGEKTTVAKHNNPTAGHVKGVPYRFRVGHHRRKAVQYVEEDRGYTTPCWIWQLHINEKGYGAAYDPTRKGQRVAYLVYYERVHGAVPAGMELDHLCRQRACVNPEHLEPVTHRENMRRGAVTKLTHDDIREMRRLAEDGMLHARIARRFGLSHTHTSRVIRREFWADII